MLQKKLASVTAVLEMKRTTTLEMVTERKTRTNGRRQRNKGSGSTDPSHPLLKFHPQGNVKNERTDQIHQPAGQAGNL